MTGHAITLTSAPVVYRNSSSAAFDRARPISGYCSSVPLILSKPYAPLRNSFPDALYRRSSEWERFGIRPPLRLGEPIKPEHQFAPPEDWPPLLARHAQSYSCSLEQISDFRHEMRVQFWHDFLGQFANYSTVPGGLNAKCPSMEKDDEQEVFLYHRALPREQADGWRVQSAHPCCCRAVNTSCSPMKG